MRCPDDESDHGPLRPLFDRRQHTPQLAPTIAVATDYDTAYLAMLCLVGSVIWLR